jgi:hypothetical protein
MRYTKNIGLKLKNLGFEFNYSMDLKETDLTIDVYTFEGIDVDINNQEKTIDFGINEDGSYLKIKGVKTLGDLVKLKKLIYNL